MSQIRITPQELLDGEAKMMGLAEKVVDLLGELNTTVNTVAANWEGAAQSSYVESFTQLHKQFSESFPPAIEGLGAQMKAAAEALQNTDAELAKAFSGQ